MNSNVVILASNCNGTPTFIKSLKLYFLGIKIKIFTGEAVDAIKTVMALSEINGFNTEVKMNKAAPNAIGTLPPKLEKNGCTTSTAAPVFPSLRRVVTYK